MVSRRFLGIKGGVEIAPLLEVPPACRGNLQEGVPKIRRVFVSRRDSFTSLRRFLPCVQYNCAVRILLTGATGYVGGRLAPRLLERGYCVRVLARDANRLAARPWREQVEVCEGDVGDADAVRRALQGVEVAYYLVHSMQSGADFAARDRRNAQAFAHAARAAGVRHVIYLGGLLPKGSAASLGASTGVFRMRRFSPRACA